MQGTEGSLQRRVSGNIQRSRKGYVKVEFLSDTEDMTYMENTLYHLGEEVELLVAQGRATERYCHPGAQEQKHSFNSRLLRQEHLLQNRIR